MVKKFSTSRGFWNLDGPGWPECRVRHHRRKALRVSGGIAGRSDSRFAFANCGGSVRVTICANLSESDFGEIELLDEAVASLACAFVTFTIRPG